MMNKSLSETNNLVITELKKLLLHGVAQTQETICDALLARGYPVNQSKISRLLRNINAIKSKNDHGEMVYRLPHDVTPPSITTTLDKLIVEIIANETMIIIKTSPGSASLIARIIDDKKCEVIGTIAGDDTIFVAPQSINRIQVTLSLISSLLGIIK